MDYLPASNQYLLKHGWSTWTTNGNLEHGLVAGVFVTLVQQMENSNARVDTNTGKVKKKTRTGPRTDRGIQKHLPKNEITNKEHDQMPKKFH